MKRWAPFLSVVVTLAILLSPLVIVTAIADGPMLGDADTPFESPATSPDPQPSVLDETPSPPTGPDVAPGGVDDSDLIIAHIYRDTIRIPKSLTNPVVLDLSGGPRIELTKLGLSDSASDAVLHNADVAQYSNTGDSTDTYIVGLQIDHLPAFSVFEILRDANAPETFRYRVDVPDGYTLTLSANGGYDLVDSNGTAHAAIAPPWAADANGDTVSVSYHYDDDGVLELRVPHRAAESAYPIVVDPLWKKIKKAVSGVVNKAKDIANDVADTAREVARYASPIILTTAGVGMLTVAFVAGVTGAITASPPLLILASSMVQPGLRTTGAGFRGLSELRGRHRNRRRRYAADHRSVRVRGAAVKPRLV